MSSIYDFFGGKEKFVEGIRKTIADTCSSEGISFGEVDKMAELKPGTTEEVVIRGIGLSKGVLLQIFQPLGVDYSEAMPFLRRIEDEELLKYNPQLREKEKEPHPSQRATLEFFIREKALDQLSVA